MRRQTASVMFLFALKANALKQFEKIFKHS